MVHMPIKFAPDGGTADALSPQFARASGAGVLNSSVRPPFGIPRIALTLAVIFGCAAIVFPVSHAQVYSGSLTGVVKDASGGVVPGASAVLTDQEKGFKYEAKTDTEGRYVLRNLPPGRYSLAVSAPAM